MQINKVTIIGGGSSGWMTAAALSELCDHLDITLVESPTFATVGVGESTLGHINRFLHLIGVQDEDWMAACNATYKNSIRFTNFRENDGTSFEYPFTRVYNFDSKPRRLETWSELATLYPNEFAPNTFAELFSPSNYYLAVYNKQTSNKDKVLPYFNFKYDTAYHMDATLFGQWLKNNIAIPNGVKHYLNEVQEVVKDSEGNIVKILCSDNQVLEADLWIDCTGFSSKLLEKEMGSDFVSFDTHLITNKAWATRIPYIDKPKELNNVTECTALGNGWVWNIPLWNRIGTGYVFSDKFVTKEQALEEFKTHLAKRDPKTAEEAEYKLIDMKQGYRKHIWIKNVVGIGLSYGFVEPLESTGLLTTHENIIRLVEILNRRKGWVTNTEKDGMNIVARRDVVIFRDFISMHYSYSKRYDTEFWRYVTDKHNYNADEIHNYNLYRSQLETITSEFTYDENLMGMNFIAAGMGIKSLSSPKLIHYCYEYFKDTQKQPIEFSYIQEVKDMYYQTRFDLIGYIRSLPSSYEFLKEHIYANQ